MTDTEADDLPALHAFIHGQRTDRPAGLTLPYSTAPQEGRQHQSQAPQTTDVRPSSNIQILARPGVDERPRTR
jgi:hypothetical protein